MIRILATAATVVVATFIATGFFTSSEQGWKAIQNAPIKAASITADHFSPSGHKMEAGGLRFAGGLVLRSSNPHFGALSGLRVANDGTLTAVTDTGFWFQGRIERNSKGTPQGIADGRMAPLLDDTGQPFSQKWFGDAEGLTFSGDKAYVSTEQDTRILEYQTDENLLTSPSSVFGPPLPGERLRYNFGLEAIATIPQGHELSGDLIALSEAPPEPGLMIRAFIWSADAVQELKVRQHDGFFVTDADFLPDGTLLLLERKFSPASGSAMRLRKIDGSKVSEGSMLEGETVFILDRRWQIDNMEGLTVFTGPGGLTRIGVVSDNNHWPLQRTLYLEFVLETQAAAVRVATMR